MTTEGREPVGRNRVKGRHEERYDQRSRLTRRRHGDEPQEPPIIDRLCCVQPSSLPLVSLLATLVVLLARFLGSLGWVSYPHLVWFLVRFFAPTFGRHPLRGT